MRVWSTCLKRLCVWLWEREPKYAVFAIVCLHVSYCMIFVTFVYLTDIVTIFLAVSLSHFLLHIHNTAIGCAHCLDAAVHVYGNGTLLNNVTMYQCATVSMCHCISVPLYQCATHLHLSLSHCNGSMLNFLSIACDTITICWLQPQHHQIHIPRELHTLYAVYGHPEILHVNKQTLRRLHM